MDARQDFEQQVALHFHSLLKRGFCPNGAAAYALKVASKVGTSPARQSCSLCQVSRVSCT
jgi:hypothetical protein